jgi:DNA polymerase III subunit alpha
MTGKIDAIVFPEAFKRLGDKVKLEVPVLVKGSVRVEEGANPKLAISQITPLEDAKAKLPNSIRIRVPLETATRETIDRLQSVCRERSGAAKVMFDLERPRDFMVVMEAQGYNVQADRAFIGRVEEICGRGSVRIID